ncbi:MAG: inorganic diphosphatase [Methanobacteriaceae archaeon]|nr:inorganic diphosphatase [Methanobacteriaceae archaeon]
MNLWKDLKSGPSAPQVVYAVIEIPKGSRNKYEYDKDMEAFALDRVLYSPVHYPAEYGIIPQTLYDDGDPMDIMVLMDQPTFPGCIIESRAIGMMRMIDGGDQDDKILAVPTQDPRYHEIQDLGDVAPHLLKEIAQFFQDYKTLEGKETEVLGWVNKEEALKAIQHSIQLYKKM